MYEDDNRLLRELTALFLIFLFVFLAVCLGTYSGQDPSFNHQVSSGFEIKNGAGILGAYISGSLVELFGVGAWFLPLLSLFSGLNMFFLGHRMVWYRWIGVFLLFVCVTSMASQPWVKSNLDTGTLNGGGLFGYILHDFSYAYLHGPGSFLLWIFCFLAGLQLTFKFFWASSARCLARIVSGIKENIFFWKKKRIGSRKHPTDKGSKPAKKNQDPTTDRATSPVPEKPPPETPQSQKAHIPPPKCPTIRIPACWIR
ncbi:MAG: DNA translocase FtsK 4TM domain-containing protein [Thermodesulfobacteriota bacterium]